jgi:hypothetical protein
VSFHPCLLVRSSPVRRLRLTAAQDELREGLREVEPETSDALGKAYTVDGGLLEAPLGLALSQLRYAGDAQRPLLVFLNPDKRRLREDTKNDVIGRVTPTMELSPSQVEQFHGGFSYRCAPCCTQRVLLNLCERHSHPPTRSLWCA